MVVLMMKNMQIGGFLLLIGLVKCQTYSNSSESRKPQEEVAQSSSSSSSAFWISMEQGTYGTVKSDHWKDELTRLGIIVVHGANQNADIIWGHMNNALQHAGSDGFTDTDEVALIAPDFSSDGVSKKSKGHDKDLRWSGADWAFGGFADGVTNATSFEVLDSLVLFFSQIDRFPVLERIVMVGFSNGANLVQRYALVGHLANSTTLPISYVPIAATSYAYLTNERPEETMMCATTYNEWKYGLSSYAISPIGKVYGSEYENKAGAKSYRKRAIAYMCGDRDVGDLSASELDTSCPANTQGSYPYDRAQKFWKTLKKIDPNITLSQSFRSIPNVGHTSDQLFASDEVADVIFRQNVSAVAPRVQEQQPVLSSLNTADTIRPQPFDDAFAIALVLFLLIAVFFTSGTSDL